MVFYPKQFLFSGGLSFLLFVVGAGLYLSRGPDFNLTWEQSVSTELSPEHLSRQIQAVTRWPQWFHGLKKAVILNPQQDHPQEIFSGALISLEIQPKNRKPFSLQIRVVEYLPEKHLYLKLLGDSSQKLTRAFDSLDWAIALYPDRIQGSSVGHTCHWQSRLFGRIAQRILMYQSFFPHLLQLAAMKHPFRAEIEPPRRGLI